MVPQSHAQLICVWGSDYIDCKVFFSFQGK